MLKICFVVYELSNTGGQQKIVVKVANALADTNKYEITILLTADKSISRDINYELHPNIKVTFNSKLPRKKYEYIPHKVLTKVHQNIKEVTNQKILQQILFPQKEIKKYQRFFESNTFDVVIGVTPRISGIISLLDIPSTKIGWMHNTIQRYFYLENDGLWKQQEIYKKLFPLLDRVVVLTEQDELEYGEFFEINPTRIYNPLTFKTNQKSFLNNNNILFVGRIFYKTKGLNYLIEIMNLVKKKNPTIKLHIVGDGPDKEKFIREINENRLNENIILHGNQKNVLKFYLNSSLLVLPSTVEGFGLVVTEAMESGLPVISFNTRGPSEIIKNGIDGYLIPNFNVEEFSNKILKLMNNVEIRKEMGKKAQERADDFSISNIIKHWNQLLKN